MLPSKEIILDWIGKICKERDDIVFIYRPHPGEESQTAKNLEEQYPNFKFIGGLSVRQWILISDKIYTGNSSTFVEAFFAKKMCYLLFPVPVPRDYELAFFKDADKIKTFDEFKDTIYNDNRPFPVSEKLIDEVYTIDWQKPSYIKFADMAEEVLNDSYYDLTRQQLKSYYHKMSVGEKAVSLLVKITPLYDLYLLMLENNDIHWKWIESKRLERKKLESTANDFEKTSDEEIEMIINKIANELEKK